MVILPRRPVIALSLLAFISLLLFTASHHDPTIQKLEKALPNIGPNNKAHQHMRSVRRRTNALRAKCTEPDEFERMYGRTNIRLSRGYEGSLWRVERFVDKILRGENVTFSAIGGSVTAGHHVQAFEVWVKILGDWINDWFPHAPGRQIKVHNGAVPATGSGYFSYCFSLHIPADSDLVVIELGVNDEPDPEMTDNMEALLRGLLSMKEQPAVMLAEAMAFSMGQMSGGGGRYHLPMAQYYDVPVVNQRHPLANHFARFPEVVPMYFSEEWDQSDLRHFNWHGHRDLAFLVASLLRDVACEMVADPEYMPPPPGWTHAEGVREQKVDDNYDQQVMALYGEDTRFALRRQEEGWAEETRSWLYQPPAPKAKRDEVEGEGEEEEEGEGEAAEANQEPPPPPPPPLPPVQWMPGFWQRPVELGMLPRLMGMESWNADLNHRVPPFHPTCKSTHSDDLEFALIPFFSEGWKKWTHPDHADKPYYVAYNVGDKVKFEIETSVGVIKVYSLFSHNMGLGKAKCWVDDAVDVGKVIDGRWGNDANIGELTTLTTTATAGKHVITCEILKETNDPDGNHEFRLIGIMGG